MLKALYVCVGLLLGILAGLALASGTGVRWAGGGSLWLIVTLGGAFGGLLYGMRDKTLTPPRRAEDGSFEPGWIADAAFGLGGGYVIFLLLPGTFADTTGWEAIKVIATAIVGGYGGRSIIDKMLAQALRETRKEMAQAKQEVQQIKTRAAQEDLDRAAITLVKKQLSAAEEKEVPQEDLEKAVAEASSAQRAAIFYEAQAVRRDNWETDKRLMERAIPVFRALIAADSEKKYHRNHGQLGYALKDQRTPDYDSAVEELTRAIEIRGDWRNTGWLFYELNRALARILRLGRKKAAAAERDAILDDLRQAAHDEWLWHEVIKKEPVVRRWLTRHEARLADVGK